MTDMPTPVCSRCGREIPPDDINVAQDVAYCRQCNLATPLSEITRGDAQGLSRDDENPIDFSHPPSGAWYHNDMGGLVVGASHRSIGKAIAALFVVIFWNGILSIFLLIALASTFKHLGIGMPEWFPAPDMNGESMGVGMTIFLWVFLTPFILVGLAMVFAFFSSLFGRTEVRINNAQGSVFTGVGPIGWTRRFDPTEIRQVEQQESMTRNDGNSYMKTLVVITTNTGRKIKFGSMLNDERREFVYAVSRHAICPREQNRRL